MDKDSIVRLAQLMPTSAPYFNCSRNGILNADYINDPNLRQRICLMEPRLGYIFARSYSKLGLALPEEVTEPHVIQAYDYLCR